MTILQLKDVPNLEREEQISYYNKLAYTKNKIYEILNENRESSTIRVTIGSQVEEEVLNIEGMVIGLLKDDEDKSILAKLEAIALRVAFDFNDLENKIQSGNIESKPYIEEPNYVYEYRHYVQELTYDLLKEEIENLDQREVYLYDNFDIYPEFISILNGFSGEEKMRKLEDFSFTFRQYYLDNREIFIKRYEYNEKLGDSFKNTMDAGRTATNNASILQDNLTSLSQLFFEVEDPLDLDENQKEIAKLFFKYNYDSIKEYADNFDGYYFNEQDRLKAYIYLKYKLQDEFSKIYFLSEFKKRVISEYGKNIGFPELEDNLNEELISDFLNITDINEILDQQFEYCKAYFEVLEGTDELNECEIVDLAENFGVRFYETETSKQFIEDIANLKHLDSKE